MVSARSGSGPTNTVDSKFIVPSFYVVFPYLYIPFFATATGNGWEIGPLKTVKQKLKFYKNIWTWTLNFVSFLKCYLLNIYSSTQLQLYTSEMRNFYHQIIFSTNLHNKMCNSDICEEATIFWLKL